MQTPSRRDEFNPLNFIQGISMTNRTTISSDALQPIGKFVVMRHAGNLKRAHLSSLHDTYESSSVEAIRLVSLAVTQHADVQHHFYVLSIAARFSGGVDGLQALEG
jgi:hypothetical protein